MNMASACVLHKIVTTVAGWIFQEDNLSSNLQARICKLESADFCRLQLSNPSKLVISKKWKLMIVLLVHNAWGLFPDGLRLM